jgi:8-oxo-dGTP diphosphatase
MASIIIIDDNHVLLLHKQTRYSDRPLWIPTAGGHFEAGELNDPEACLWREVNEELGLPTQAFENVNLRYIALSNSGEQIRTNYYYFASLREDFSRDLSNNEGELQWFAFNEAKNCDMPLSLKACFSHYLDFGCNDDYIYTALGTLNTNDESEYVITPLNTR